MSVARGFGLVGALAGAALLAGCANQDEMSSLGSRVSTLEQSATDLDTRMNENQMAADRATQAAEEARAAAEEARDAADAARQSAERVEKAFRDSLRK